MIEEIWITKYALTKGVYHLSGGDFEVASPGSPCPGSVTVPSRYFSASVRLFLKNEWWLTEEEALAHVEVMKKKQRASLEEKLKALDGKKVKIIDLSRS